jgi:hypothetical protein
MSTQWAVRNFNHNLSNSILRMTLHFLHSGSSDYSATDCWTESFKKTQSSTDLLYVFFWVIPQHLNFICRRFRTLCLFQLRRRVRVECHSTPIRLWRQNRQSAPKRRHIKFRCWGELPTKKTYNIQDTAKVWNQKQCRFVRFSFYCALKKIKSWNTHFCCGSSQEPTLLYLKM